MQSLWVTDRRTAASVLAGTVALACAGHRLVRLLRARGPENVYESPRLLAEYLHFHYAQGSEALPHEGGPRDALDFPARCAHLCIEQSLGPEAAVPSRALDVGCAVGRSTFELTRRFQSVLGVDLSQGFVRASEKLQDAGSMRYSATEEGDLCIDMVARVPPDIDRGRCSFMQADACALPRDLGTFGCVLAANLLCRLPDPMAFLNRVPGLVAPGGVLVITAPYTWLESFTPKSAWLGGYTDASGKPVRGAETLKRVLSPNFTLLWEGDLPFLLRETARKHQWTAAHATAWRRKG
ncbi:uncharacterized protein LOC144943361 [Lampetra fluviatilis]